MRIVQILIAAVMLGLAAGYAWSAMAPHPTARPHLPKPTMMALPDAPDSESDKEWAARGADSEAPVVQSSAPDPEAAQQSVHYSDCDEARAAGKAPIHQGQPGYRAGLDADSDGIACEPYHGN